MTSPENITIRLGRRHLPLIPVVTITLPLFLFKPRNRFLHRTRHPLLLLTRGAD
ncbi:hypothetical protein SEA_KERSH_26 [Mycobacterium phage Kersh]|uniref:Uncharacterized protein n=1 Tax=Mycobacterium phage Kersh TaxID=1897501 RepID=A0A1D8EXU1_9CAUD|nr:hypothetical protein I5H52_gp026 [Mycobacterium phage Kersh]AOT26015.1 hypothetical protein SEA_KERSH_26 [Mycobacterium phage Kersh]